MTSFSDMSAADLADEVRDTDELGITRKGLAALAELESRAEERDTRVVQLEQRHFQIVAAEDRAEAAEARLATAESRAEAYKERAHNAEERADLNRRESDYYEEGRDALRNRLATAEEALRRLTKAAYGCLGATEGLAYKGQQTTTPTVSAALGELDDAANEARAYFAAAAEAE